LEADHLSQAIGYYELALERCPDFANAAFNLAIAHQRIGKLPQAA
jgi:tetratricopeptide (TPR) repeat protein